MWFRLGAIAGFILLVSACSSAPVQAPLEEARSTYQQRARARFETGDLGGAAHNFRRAFALAEMADDHDSMIANLLNLGGTLTLMGEYDSAGSAYQQAKRRASLHHKPEWEMRALSGLAEIAYRKGNAGVAAERYRQLLDHPGTRSDVAVRSTALNGLALSEMSTGNLEAANQHLKEAEALIPSVSASGKSATLLNRATLELRQDSFASAARAANAALAIDREIGYTPGIAADLELLGRINEKQGKVAQARLYFTQALNLYKHLEQNEASVRVQSQLESLSP